METRRLKPSNFGNQGLTSDSQLYRECKNIDGFLGVFDRNNIPTSFFKHKGSSIIVNLDPNYKRGGTHWVASRNANDGPCIYYFDSFGRVCPSIITNMADRYGLGILASDIQYQKLNQNNCGQWAVSFIKAMDKGNKKRKELETFMKICNVS